MNRKQLILILGISCSLTAAAQTKTFKWIAWKNVPAAVKADLKTFIKYKKVSVYDDIIEMMEEGCEVEVAVVDLSGDGSKTYAIRENGSYCCGSAGCAFDVYKDKGRKQINLTDYWDSVKPAKNGITSSAGLFFPFNTRN